MEACKSFFCFVFVCLLFAWTLPYWMPRSYSACHWKRTFSSLMWPTLRVHVNDVVPTSSIAALKADPKTVRCANFTKRSAKKRFIIPKLCGLLARMSCKRRKDEQVASGSRNNMKDDSFSETHFSWLSYRRSIDLWEIFLYCSFSVTGWTIVQHFQTFRTVS